MVWVTFTPASSVGTTAKSMLKGVGRGEEEEDDEEEEEEEDEVEGGEERRRCWKRRLWMSPRTRCSWWWWTRMMTRTWWWVVVLSVVSIGGGTRDWGPIQGFCCCWTRERVETGKEEEGSATLVSMLEEREGERFVHQDAESQRKNVADPASIRTLVGRKKRGRGRAE